MKQAQSTKHLPSKKAQVERATKYRSAQQGFQDKTFNELTPEEKDELLRLVAVRLNMIKESS